MERRLAAVLAYDVVGYSRAMGVDEVGTLETLKAHRQEVIDPRVKQHGGRTIKLMGDGALLEFSSVVDAVRFAVGMQRAIAERNERLVDRRELCYRIGVNVGDIIAEGRDIYGDGVNVAARLEGLAEPGGICVRRSARNEVRGKLDLDFEDLGAVEVKNIERPIHAFRVVMNEKAAALAAEPARSRRSRLPSWTLLTGLAALALLIAGSLWWWPRGTEFEPVTAEAMSLPMPDRPSIAVLPFDSLSPEPDQSYFADGMTEDLITDLSKNPELFVIARNTSFAYRDKALDIPEIAKQLGVRYLLEGSVRRSGDDVRINAQLIDAITGGHLWAERYDGTMTDIFALQDKVTARIVTALSLTLREGINEQSGTESAEAYDAFLRGWQHYRLDVPTHYAAALAHFESALELDPGFHRARAAIASIYWRSYQEQWTQVLGQGVSGARRKALETIEQVPDEPMLLADQVRSQIALWRNRHEDAIRLARRATTLDPNAAEAQATLAGALIYGGHPDQARLHVANARRHDPAHEARYAFLEGLADFVSEEFEAAAREFERTLELSPELWNPSGDLKGAYCLPCLMLIATYGHIGQREKAGSLINDFRRHWAGVSINSVIWDFPFRSGADLDRYRTGLAKAGMPEL